MKLLLPILLLANCLAAQTPASSFEAAAIKPSNQPPGHSSSHTRTGMLVVQNESLRQLIRDAYRINDNQIEGGPKWMEADRFDINAKSIGPSEGQELMAMLQNLLADRFKLVFHKETRPLPGYALVVTKSGMKIKPSGSGDGGSNTNSNNGRTHMEMTHVTMEGLATVLARQLHLPVVDETGIKDLFTFQLDWTQENLSSPQQPGDPRDGPSLFTALQETLGLKLESRKVPTEMLVIDSAEKPSVD